MSVLARRELELIMRMDDQTKAERAALNRSLGDIERTSKRTSDEVKRNLLEVAKASKQQVEGINAVLQLGGWLTLATGVGKALADITAEARKNSEAFKSAGATLDVVGKKAGAALTRALEPLAEGFSNVLIYGSAVFENFPAVAEVSFKLIQKMLGTALSWDGLKTIVVGLATGIVSILGNSFTSLPEFLKNVFTPMATYLSNFFKWMGEQFKNAFTLQWDKMTPPPAMGDIAAETMKGTIDGITKRLGTLADGLSKSLAPVWGLFADDISAAGDQIGTIIQPTVDQLKKAIADAKDAADNPPATGGGYISASAYENSLRFRSPGDTGLGWSATAPQTATGNLQGMPSLASLNQIEDTVSPVLNAIQNSIGGFLTSLSSIKSIMDPITTIMQAAFEVLGPLIDNLLAPLVGILRVVGQTIGKILTPALEVLRPVIDAIANMFVGLYNIVIVPIGNAIIGVFNLIYDFVASFVNLLYSILNGLLGALGVKIALLETRGLGDGQLAGISLDQLAFAGSSGGTGGSGAGSSASYAAGTSVTIEKIEIRADFIAGDAGLQDVAVMIRDKILEAERAGR